MSGVAGPVFTLRITGELLYFGASEQKTELNLKEFGKLRAHLRREVAGITDVQQVANALGQLHLDITLDGPKFMADFGAWDALLAEAREEQPDPEGGLGAAMISGNLMDGGLDGLTDLVAELLNDLDFDFSADTSFQIVEVAPDGPHAQPEQQQAQVAREVETGYPEAGYQTLAEGLRRLAAGRKALPAPLTYEQTQASWRAHMAEATRLQESLRTAPLEQVEGIRQQVHAEVRECQRLTDLEQALLGEVRW